MEQASSTFTPEGMDSEDEMFILYTSGTGKKEPRGIVHTQAGYLLNVTLVHKVCTMLFFIKSVYVHCHATLLVPV